MGRNQKGWTVEGGGRFTENFVGLLTHIEEQGSLQLDPPPPPGGFTGTKMAQLLCVSVRFGALTKKE